MGLGKVFIITVNMVNLLEVGELPVYVDVSVRAEASASSSAVSVAPCISMSTSVGVGLDDAVDVCGSISVAVTNCVDVVVSMAVSMIMTVAVIKTVAMRVVVTVGAVVAVGSVTVIIRAGNSSAVLGSDHVVLDDNSFDGSGFRSVTLVKAAIAEFVSAVPDEGSTDEIVRGQEEGTNPESHLV